MVAAVKRQLEQKLACWMQQLLLQMCF